MKYTKECRLMDFPFWGDGKTTADYLSGEDMNRIEDCLDNFWYTDPPSEEDVNDLFRDDTDLIAQWLGYKDWDDMLEQRGVQ